MTMRWRLIENEWNLKGAPWSDAVGIEEDDNSVAVPAIVCWFMRWPNSKVMAAEVCRLHNGALGETVPEKQK